MRLKRLRLQGYKTFASRQEFEFDEGITAIVGPNGSGKSNIADALRWVFGEQSYSQLRGKRTTDMIFVGSEQRSRAGMAQVVVTLDNSSKWLPIDYAEVEIGRRAFRSGENEYLLNGQKVRLRDISELLAQGGLGERNYAIIGQGLIDQALSLRPEERRSLFEEAAGITHYKVRRAETLRRLQETQVNLQRVHDILSEIRPRLNALRRQANRAQNYEQVAQDLRQLLREYYGFQFKRVHQRLRERRAEARRAETDWKNSRASLIQHQEKLTALRSSLAELQEKERQLQGNRTQIRDQWEESNRRVAVLDARRGMLTAQLEEINSNLPESTSLVQRTQSDLDKATSTLESAQHNLGAVRQEMAVFQASYDNQRITIQGLQSRISHLRNRQRQLESATAQAEGKLSQLQERLKEQRDVVVDASQWKAGKQQMKEAERAVQAANDRLQQLQNEKRQHQDNVQESGQHLREMRQAYQKLLQQVNLEQKEMGRLEARLETLGQLRLEGIVLPDNVKMLGHFAALIDIPAAYQPAIAAALQSRLQTLLLPDRDNLMALLDQSDQGFAAVANSHLVPPEPIPLPGVSGVIGWAVDLVDASKEAEPLAQVLLGALLLADSRESALKAVETLPFGYAAVTPDGILFHSSGLVEARPSEGLQNTLSLETAWREAGSSLENKRESVALLAAKLVDAEGQVNQQQAVIDSLNQSERELASQEQACRQALAEALRSQDRAKQALAALEKQEKQSSLERSRLQTRVMDLEKQRDSDLAELKTVRSSLTDAESEFSAMPVAELSQQRESQRQQVETAQTIVAGRQAVVDSRRETLKQAEEQKRRALKLHAILQQQLEQLEDELPTDQLSILEEQLKAVNNELVPVRERVSEVQKKLLAAERETAALQRTDHEQETRFTQSRIALNQQESQLDLLRDRIQNDLGIVSLPHDDDESAQDPLPIGEIVESLPDVDSLAPEIESEIQQYRGQLRRMGAINPDAPQEYEETQTRFEFLSHQVEDLEATETQLRQVIAELDDLTSVAFASTVEKVDLVFSTMFTRLFGGGSAELILTDPDDLTISGVDIHAQLPNRRQQGLGVLSGGERSLTAAALVFALLKVSPTPFCVMDEVDAMLDEANINRFVEVLDELSQNTQFIVITHNRGTVQAASTVYGISLGADSTSSVLSIKPEDYIRQEKLTLAES